MIKKVLILKKQDFEKMLKAVDTCTPKKPFALSEHLYMDDDDLRRLIREHLQSGIKNAPQKYEEYAILLWKEYEEKPYFLPEYNYIWQYINENNCRYDYVKIDTYEYTVSREGNLRSLAYEIRLDVNFI